MTQRSLFFLHEKVNKKDCVVQSMEENLWINHVRIIREKIGRRVFGLFKIYFLHVLNL